MFGWKVDGKKTRASRRKGGMPFFERDDGEEKLLMLVLGLFSS
jgi:hypothetical protein